MKGVIFTEFLNLVEAKYGYETVDSLIEESNLHSKGAYTAIGTYPHSEMVKLVTNLSIRTHIPIQDVLKMYGTHLFSVFAQSYGHFLCNITSSFQLFLSIDKYIHVEVQKIYPDAELPSFECTLLNGTTLEMLYKSERRMGDFAEGLIEATLSHYKEKATIERTDIKEDGTIVRFVIQKAS
jgi:Haem-NO-binding